MKTSDRDDYLIYPLSDRRNFTANKRKLAVEQLHKDMQSARTPGAVSLLLYQFQQKLSRLDREDQVLHSEVKPTPRASR